LTNFGYPIIKNKRKGDYVFPWYFTKKTYPKKEVVAKPTGGPLGGIRCNIFEKSVIIRSQGVWYERKD